MDLEVVHAPRDKLPAAVAWQPTTSGGTAQLLAAQTAQTPPTPQPPQLLLLVSDAAPRLARADEQQPDTDDGSRDTFSETAGAPSARRQDDPRDGGTGDGCGTGAGAGGGGGGATPDDPNSTPAARDRSPFKKPRAGALVDSEAALAIAAQRGFPDSDVAQTPPTPPPPPRRRPFSPAIMMPDRAPLPCQLSYAQVTASRPT